MIRAALVALSLLLIPAAASAELRSPEIYTDFRGVALKGYDVVAYHTDRKPVKGTESLAYEWKDAIWFFATAEHRDMFIADPERWAPQYGGYCAWAIAEGMTRPINPKIFRIFDDKLYFNLNMKVHKKWLGEYRNFIIRANDEWPDVLVMAK